MEIDLKDRSLLSPQDPFSLKKMLLTFLNMSCFNFDSMLLISQCINMEVLKIRMWHLSKTKRGNPIFIHSLSDFFQDGHYNIR